MKVCWFHAGSIVIKRDIEHIGQRTVTFKDGETIEVDAIIFATGYSISFPFLNKTNITVGQDNDISLFKFVWNPDLMKDNTPPTLAFIGLVQPFGAIMPIAEIQARWITRVWAGEVGLPTADEQRADISEYKDYLAKRWCFLP
jgi:dimethylaniline monooxygenase (N-oxide forming)